MDPGLRSICQGHPEIAAKMQKAIDSELRGVQMTPESLQELKAGLMGELDDMNKAVQGNPQLLDMIRKRLDKGGKAVAAASVPPILALLVRPWPPAGPHASRPGYPGAPMGRREFAEFF